MAGDAIVDLVGGDPRPVDIDGTTGPTRRAEHGPLGAEHMLGAGKRLADRYHICRFLARGGMGEVYEAEDEELRERVALKVIRREIAADEGTIKRFKREVQLARKVTHRSVCRLYEFGYHALAGGERLTFLTMELLSGETLTQRLARAGRFRPEAALPLILQMTDGLDAAHQVGVIHRDLKSNNVLLVPHDPGAAEGERAVLTDFGSARGWLTDDPFARSASPIGHTLGTPAYMSPEQVTRDPLSPATDIYSLGVVLYEMLTGRLPFRGRTRHETAVERVIRPPPAPMSLCPELDERWNMAILRCLERKPEARFPRAIDVGLALAGDRRRV